MKFAVLCGATILVAVILVSAVAAQSEIAWHQEPFKLLVGGQPLDIPLDGYVGGTQSSSDDLGGHAAPFLADLDGDGKRDLVVGSFSGRFRYYRNIGSDAAPLFPKEYSWLRSGSEIAQVHIYCCVASGPQLVDIDGDGFLDLSAGSYDPGLSYWFKGRGSEQFFERQILTDASGAPVLTHAETFYEGNKRMQSFVSNIAWVDWNDDGRLDMLLGNGIGELFVSLAQKPLGSGADGITAFATQPRLSDRLQEIKIQQEKAILDGHCAPAVGDWDGDGRWDILIGSYSGAVYWLRNSGSAATPEFKNRVLLVGAGEGMQWLEVGQSARRGVRSQINVADYNGDGKLDLLVGTWNVSEAPFPGLNRQQRNELRALREKLLAVDSAAGYEFNDFRSKSHAYGENKALNAQAYSLLRQLDAYQETRQHGQVWVFLQR